MLEISNKSCNIDCTSKVHVNNNSIKKTPKIESFVERSTTILVFNKTIKLPV